MAGLGAEVTEIRLPPLEQYAACNRVILLSEAYAVHQKDLQTRLSYSATTRRPLTGAFISAADYVNALRTRENWSPRLMTPWGLDAAVTVSSHETPANLSDMQEVERTYGRQARAPFTDR